MDTTLLTAIIAGVAGVIASLLTTLITLGVYKHKIDTAEKDINALQEDIKKINRELAECSIKIEERTSSSVSSLTKRKSPISLTERGEELLKRSGMDKFILEHKDLLLDKIKEHNPKTAYDVQEWAKTVLQNVSNENIFTPLKNFLFKEGYALDSLIVVGQIYLETVK